MIETHRDIDSSPSATPWLVLGSPLIDDGCGLVPGRPKWRVGCQYEAMTAYVFGADHQLRLAGGWVAVNGGIRVSWALLHRAGLVPCAILALAVDLVGHSQTVDDSETIANQPLESAAAAGIDPIASESAVEEVIVVGDQTLVGLRQELYRAQDRVHELFNALNDDDDFDIHCHMETRTGTRISRRVCKANYVDQATAVQGQAFLAFTRGEAGSAQPPSAEVIQFNNKLLRQKLTELVNANSELRDAVARFSELSENYESAQRRILDSKKYQAAFHNSPQSGRLTAAISKSRTSVIEVVSQSE